MWQSIWKNATEPQPCCFKPEGNGWLKTNEGYQFEWFAGDQVLQSLCEILTSEQTPSLTQDDEDEEDVTLGETLK